MARQYNFIKRKKAAPGSRKHRYNPDLHKNKMSLAAFLKDKDDAVRQAAADALNEAADEIKQQMVSNLVAQGITNRTGTLYSSIEFDPATAKRPRVLIKSEASVDAPPMDRQGIINPAMKGRYTDDKVPYGRLIEFSPRIKKPFFYKAWYDKMNQVKDDIINRIGKAWAKQ